jgi:protein-S-isoprenylcysteine O-methyltransferase Ste14
VPVALPVVRGLLVLGNFAVIARTARENAFLTPVVKAQADPGQRVISSGSGPYAVVRHPMYAGALLLVFGTPLLLGSLYGLASAAVLAVLLAVRGDLRERSLAARAQKSLRVFGTLSIVSGSAS